MKTSGEIIALSIDLYFDDLAPMCDKYSIFRAFQSPAQNNPQAYSFWGIWALPQPTIPEQMSYHKTRWGVPGEAETTIILKM